MVFTRFCRKILRVAFTRFWRQIHKCQDWGKGVGQANLDNAKILRADGMVTPPLGSFDLKYRFIFIKVLNISAGVFVTNGIILLSFASCKAGNIQNFFRNVQNFPKYFQNFQDFFLQIRFLHDRTNFT